MTAILESSLKNMMLDFAKDAINKLYSEGIDKFDTVETAYAFIEEQEITIEESDINKLNKSSKKEKTKKEKSKSDKPKTKRTPHAYNLYFTSQRSIVKAELEKSYKESGKELKSKEIMSEVAARWKLMNDEEKNPWNEKAAKLKSDAVVQKNVIENISDVDEEKNEVNKEDDSCDVVEEEKKAKKPKEKKAKEKKEKKEKEDDIE